MSVQIIHADGAPAAIGPYAQATVAGGFLFTAGQIPLDPKSMERSSPAISNRRPGR